MHLDHAYVASTPRHASHAQHALFAEDPQSLEPLPEGASPDVDPSQHIMHGEYAYDEQYEPAEANAGMVRRLPCMPQIEAPYRQYSAVVQTCETKDILSYDARGSAHCVAVQTSFVLLLRLPCPRNLIYTTW